MDIPVSVLITTYNHEEFIAQCIDSVLMQETNFKIEIILGEDHSTDGTRAICQEYAQKHSDKIRLFLRNREDVIYINGNATGRFNFMENLKVARGKYVALCEGDDYWTDPLKLQKQVDFMEQNSSYGICFHRAKVLRNDSDLELHPIPPSEDNVYSYADLLRHYNFITTASAVFRIPKDFTIPSWFTEVNFGDLALYYLVARNKKIKCLDSVMSVYRVHAQGVYQRLNAHTQTFLYLNFYKVIIPHLNPNEMEIVRKKRRRLIVKICKNRFGKNALLQFLYKSYLNLKY